MYIAARILQGRKLRLSQPYLLMRYAGIIPLGVFMTTYKVRKTVPIYSGQNSHIEVLQVDLLGHMREWLGA